MNPRTVNWFADCLGAFVDATAGSRMVRGLTTDSRRLQAGCGFLAIRGDRMDGHDYVEAAFQTGAVMAVVDASRASAFAGKDFTLLTTADSRVALGVIGGRYRSEFSPLTIAVAGSNGKTTTKEFLGHVFSQAGPTVRSAASFNNDLGVPLTLLEIDSSTRFLINEVGTNHPGELSPLLSMVRPSVGVLTSLGREHLEFFGDLEGVADEEGGLAEALPSTGLLVVNGDTPLVERVIDRSRARVVRVGFGDQNAVRLANYSMDSFGAGFELVGNSGAQHGAFRIRHWGRHQALNAALAAVTGLESGLTHGEVQAGLLATPMPPMRLEVTEQAGVRLVNDAYNANEDSMKAALQTLEEIPASARRVAVLGDMAELGEGSEEAHFAVGRAAGASRIDHLFVVGRMASVFAQGARLSGFSCITELPTVGDAVQVVPRFICRGDTVLIKASRSTKLEAVGKAVLERATELAAS